MATTHVSRPGETRAATRSPFADPIYQGFSLLRVGFTVAPILFGLDKFLNWLTDWPHYLAPEINDIIPGNAHQAMLAIGVIEIVAGLGQLVEVERGHRAGDVQRGGGLVPGGPAVGGAQQPVQLAPQRLVQGGDAGDPAVEVISRCHTGNSKTQEA